MPLRRKFYVKIPRKFLGKIFTINGLTSKRGAKVKLTYKLSYIQGWLKGGGGNSKNPPLELKILEKPPPPRKILKYPPPPSKIRREAPAPNWI